MKKSIYLLFSFAALLFVISVHNDVLAGSSAKLKIESVDQTDPSRGSINVSRSNIKRLSIAIDDLEKIQKIQSVRGTPVNTTRSNIKSVSLAIDNYEKSEPKKRAAALASVKKANEALGTSIMELHKSIVKTYPTQAADIKAKHDAVVNAINNIK